MPLIWPAFVPSRYGTRYAYGHVVEHDRHLIVSGGLGTSIIPARLGVPPEIVHVALGASKVRFRNDSSVSNRQSNEMAPETRSAPCRQFRLSLSSAKTFSSCSTPRRYAMRAPNGPSF